MKMDKYLEKLILLNQIGNLKIYNGLDTNSNYCNQSKNESKSTENLDTGNTIESLERKFSKEMMIQYNSNEKNQNTPQFNTQETMESLSNDKSNLDLMYSTKDSNEQNITINSEINKKSLVEFISGNLVEIIISNHSNSDLYSFDNKFYEGYFQLFSSSHQLGDALPKNLKTKKNYKNIIKKDDKEQIINKMSSLINEIVNKLESEISTIIISMIYLKRILSEQNLFISLDTVLYVFYMLLVLAHKYNEDLIFSSKAMAKIIKVPISSFNKMELFLCHLLDHRFYVQEEDYKNDEIFIKKNMTYYA